MWSWINGSGGGGGGGNGLLIVKKENIHADDTVIIPTGYTVLNVVVVLESKSATGGITQISIGDNPVLFDNYVPQQYSVPQDVVGAKNTILIDQTPQSSGTILIIHSDIWQSQLSFYFNLAKYK